MAGSKVARLRSPFKGFVFALALIGCSGSSYSPGAGQSDAGSSGAPEQVTSSAGAANHAGAAGSLEGNAAGGPNAGAAGDVEAFSGTGGRNYEGSAGSREQAGGVPSATAGTQASGGAQNAAGETTGAAGASGAVWSSGGQSMAGGAAGADSAFGGSALASAGSAGAAQSSGGAGEAAVSGLELRSSCLIQASGLQPEVRLCNTTPGNIDASAVVITYWFTVEGDPGVVAEVLYGLAEAVVRNNVGGPTGATRALVVTMKEGTVVDAGSCVEVDLYVHTTTYLSVFAGEGDYSYMAGEWVPNQRIGLYDDRGVLVWGVEPEVTP